MYNKQFEGWYYKQRSENYMLAFIPGRAESGAFVQMIDNSGTKNFEMPDFYVNGNTVRTGNCIFSPSGAIVQLPGVVGTLSYGNTTPLCSDIMGPFAHLPMQCKHGVVSMYHTVNGSIIIDGEKHIFNGGSGYTEKDCGRSFPKSYIWLQCNDFPIPCSVMLSIAHIPFLGFSFSGCICAIIYQGQEYRFATYNGVKILKAENNKICLKQGDLVLKIKIRPNNSGHSLFAPKNGKMSQVIRESCDAYISLHLTRSGQTIVKCESQYATYEKR